MERGPGDSHRIIAVGFENRLLRGNDRDLSAILSANPITATQQPPALDHQSRLLAAVEPQQQATLAARLEAQVNGVSAFPVIGS